jgi:type IX secretion system PorP/SprF family membrane protein
MKKNIKLILLSICFPFGLMAQELINSQFYLNRVNTNPAFIGEANMRININSRSQWMHIPSKLGSNFVSSNAVFDMPICRMPNLGIGARGAYEIHGQTGLQTSSFHVGLAQKFEFRRLSFRGSIETGFLNRSLTGSQLIYSDQIDPIRGVISSSSNSGIALLSVFTPNFNAGIIASYKNQKKSSSFKRAYIGIAVHNLTSPQLNLISSNSDETIARRYTIHGTGLFVNRRSVAFVGNLRYMHLENLGTNVLDIFVNGVKQSNNRRQGASFTIGGGFRTSNSRLTKNTHSALAAFGFTWEENSQLMVSTDINVGGFSTGSLSTWELSLIWNFDDACKKARGRRSSVTGYLGCADL